MFAVDLFVAGQGKVEEDGRKRKARDVVCFMYWTSSPPVKTEEKAVCTPDGKEGKSNPTILRIIRSEFHHK